jgi:hypothetical protein
MNTVDYVFLGTGVLILGLMLVGSKVFRAVLWETLRHPFRPSRIEIHHGQVVITHPQSIPTLDSQPRSPSGTR